ncbi:GTPase Era [Clostridium acetireducens DSM 10703]|uniref:GTPase Era n=1 Tax=Clostridium acetireducens DSM 10703 TaxID=1121290 RepID=A0A1E8F138_9CLOT|nr:GTPase Era [Clostridium acetireducens]OFI07177.1 GTPase Era [Clostridium acetireducens DSM 10703]
MKSGFITIIGRPNVGKSTLLNKIMGEKLSIVSSKPQTTRNNIQTILTKKDEYQLIFVDTPGIHKPKHKLGEYMVKIAEQSIKEVDLIIFITNPSKEVGRGDQFILEQLKNTDIPVFLVVNKIDEYKPEVTAQTLEKYSQIYDFAEYIPMSAIKGKNVNTLLELMIKYIPEGPQYYPEEMIIDQQERFIIGEILREKALRFLSQEVPHGIAVDIISMKKNEKGIYNINADIICEKESHKGIIIGKNGEMLKRISTRARQDMEKFLMNKVNLQVWVKVRKDWRDNFNNLKEFGYK